MAAIIIWPDNTPKPPTPHAASHEAGGSDAVTLQPSQVQGLSDALSALSGAVGDEATARSAGDAALGEAIDALDGSLHPVARSGSYDDLEGTPPAPDAADVAYSTADPVLSGTSNVKEALDLTSAAWSGEMATKADTADLGTPDRPGGTGFRQPTLSNWFSALAAATEADPVDVVLISDSIWDFGTVGSDPSPGALLARELNASVGMRGALGPSSTVPAAVHGQSNLGHKATSTQGTIEATATAAQGSRLTNGQVLTHTATMTGVSVVYRTDPSFGTLTIRDGAGGTVLATINCAAAARSGNVWTSGALSDASHTLHVTSTGTTVVEMIVPTYTGQKVRVWPCGLGGSRSDQYVTDPFRALDLIDTLEAAGSLGLVLIATGANDNAATGGYATAMTDLLDAVRSHTDASVAAWFPYLCPHFPAAEYAAARPVWEGLDDVARIDGSMLAPESALTTDGTHPAPVLRAALATQAAGVLTGDPIGVAQRAILAPYRVGQGSEHVTVTQLGVGIHTATTSAQFNATGVGWNGDTVLGRSAAGVVSIGSPLSVLFGTPDGTAKLAKVTGLAAPTAGSEAANKTYVDGLVDDLSGVTDPAAARTALGLGSSSTRAVGTTTGTVAAGDDARLTNARTPTAHAASHQDGGSDELALDGSQIQTGVVAPGRLGSGSPSAGMVLDGAGRWLRGGFAMKGYGSNIGYGAGAKSGSVTPSLNNTHFRLLGPFPASGWAVTAVGIDVLTGAAGALVRVGAWRPAADGTPGELLYLSPSDIPAETDATVILETFTPVEILSAGLFVGAWFGGGSAPTLRAVPAPTPLEMAWAGHLIVSTNNHYRISSPGLAGPSPGLGNNGAAINVVAKIQQV